MFSHRADGEMSKRLMENFAVLGNELSPSFLLLNNKCMWRNANELEGGASAACFIRIKN